MFGGKEPPISEYYSIKCRDPLIAKEPSWDKVYLSIPAYILAKEREFEEVSANLKATRSHYELKKKELKQRWDELEKKEESFRKAIIDFNAFFKENDQKRDRALKKADHERHIQAVKDEDMELLNFQLDHLDYIKGILVKKTYDYKRFEDFLNDVVAYSSEYSEPKEILDRHMTLLSTYSVLLEREVQGYKKMDEFRALQAKVIVDKNNSAVAYSNQVSKYQSELDRLESSSMKREGELEHILATSANKTLVLGQVGMAVLNLYQATCRERHETPIIPFDKTIDQLHYIKEALEEIIDVIRELAPYSNIRRASK